MMTSAEGAQALRARADRLSARREATPRSPRAARTGVEAEIVIKEGEPVAAIHETVKQDDAIKVLVLAAGHGRRGPGPLVSRIGKGRPLAGRPIAITVVPGGLNDEEMDEMGGLAG